MGYQLPRAVIEANIILDRLGVVEPPVPVEELAVKMGLQVVRAPASGSESAFLIRDSNRVIIGVNSRQSRRRQRFSIGHEIGHWRMHDGRPLIVDHSIRINKRDDVSSAATDSEEIEANAFAAALLMPRAWVQSLADQYLEYGVNDREDLVQRLAGVFDVSTEAMRFRLINLGIFAG